MSVMHVAFRPGRALALVVLLAAASGLRPSGAFALDAASGPAGVPRSPRGTDLSGTVADSVSEQPLTGAEVSVTQAGHVVLNTTTDDFGRYTAHNLAAGTYQVSVHYIGYHPQTKPVTIGAGGDVQRLDFHLAAAVINLSAVEVRAAVPVSVNTRTGDQVFKENEYHGAPTNTTSQLLQQSIAGAVRAPTGEVHIRGQHAEYTYYIDGVPVPSGVSGSLNEVFDPQVVNQVSFQTGGWDAEYGNKNAAVINVQTKIPSGGFHADASTYTGSFDSHGGSLNLSTNAGRFGFFGSGTVSSTGMRREPLVFDTTTFEPINFHNHGQDVFLFGKVQFTPGSRDAMNLDVDWSQTRFQVPFDSAGGAHLDDRETDGNAFANLAWHHQFGDSAVATVVPSELFVGAFLRGGSLDYLPGAGDVPQFRFYPDTTQYNLSEVRSFTATGVKADYRFRPAQGLEAKTGILTQFTSGHESFRASDARGRTGPSSNSGLNGSDVGGYGQIAYSPVERFELRTGIRYDAHTAPFLGTARQWSPRVRLNFFPSPATSMYAYYGRMFMPPNVEDLRSITNAAVGDSTTPIPTRPERDNFYELGLVHRFPVAGIVAKVSGYYKDSRPGMDDATIPGSAIVTSVNIQHVLVRGVDGTIELGPSGPFSGYLNASISHAAGSGVSSGAFLPMSPPAGWFDLDHDQRLSLVGSGTYAASRFFASATAIYGSGLPNGRDPADAGFAGYGTGLSAFNSPYKVSPNTIVNVSTGYTFITGSAVVRPQLYVDNLFDRHYLLKGAFFSGASVGRPRSIQLRVNVGL